MIRWLVEIKLAQFRGAVAVCELMGERGWAEHWRRHILLWEVMR